MHSLILSPALTPVLATLVEEPLRGGGPDLTRYFTVVGVLIVAVLGLGWGFRRLLAGALKTRATKRSLQVVDVLPLGGKRQVTIVRCYDRTFALGMGEKDVSLIAELDSVFVPEPEEGEVEADIAERGFLQLFDRAKQRIAKAPVTTPDPTGIKELVG